VSAELVDWLLYIVVLLTTLSGWFAVSAKGWTIYLFGAAALPHLVERGSALGRSIGDLHATLTWVLLGLVGLHVVTALVHLFIYRDRVMYRMLPGNPVT